MSLNAAERAATAQELAANCEEADLSEDQLRELTGLDPARFELAFAVSPRSDPADVWLVRDTVQTAVEEAGGELTPFSVLTEQMRSAAASWFGVTDRR